MHYITLQVYDDDDEERGMRGSGRVETSYHIKTPPKLTTTMMRREMRGSGRVEVPTRVNPKVSRQTIHHPHLRQPSSSSSSSSTSLSLSSLSSKQLSATTASITTETCHSNHHPQRKDLILIKIVAVKMNIEHPPGLGVGYSQALKPAADMLLYHPDCHSPSHV